ncbi:hypothetical protein GOP47_0014238 [Adiantum capillus-veneris]|uniref:Uncharacterized protein n=1 Tax=Adiantum capillus-veneris TaxID=13818 RepID=A0A9D4ZDY7_ADICA|nr:hypothetical protein GOP47_0014238 [Adiantum capillus-veneris]
MSFKLTDLAAISNVRFSELTNATRGLKIAYVTREQGNGASLLTEKKARMKITDREECAEERWRVSSGSSYGASNEGGRAVLTNNQINSMLLSGGRLKGGSVMQARHLAHSLVLDNSAASEVAFAEGGSLSSKKRRADEESALPHWGHGKRSRGSRFEPSKHAFSIVGVASKSNGRSEKVTAPLPAPKVRGPSSKLTCNKSSPNSIPPRNALTSKTANGVVPSSSNNNNSHSLRQRGGEAKDRNSQKERASSATASQHKGEIADHGNYRLLQKGDGTELATTTHRGHLQSNGHINKVTKNIDGACNGQSLISPITNAPCNSLCEQLSLSCGLKSRADSQILEWPRIVIALTRKEKEDDFLVLKGSKLPQRPKKRPKAVERALHYCTPGNWLIDLSRGRYDVREKKSGRKKPRGLKAMESLESETE